MGDSRQHNAATLNALLAVRPTPTGGIPRARDWLTPRHKGLSYLAAIEALEEELDAIWPGWRRKQPYAQHPDEALIRRVRWLLCRRAQLVAGRDWGVYLEPHPPRPGGCIARAIQPPADPVLLEEYRGRRVLFEGPPYSRPSPLHVTAAGNLALQLAGELGLHPADVTACLAQMPAGATPRVWVRHHCTRRPHAPAHR